MDLKVVQRVVMQCHNKCPNIATNNVNIVRNMKLYMSMLSLVLGGGSVECAVEVVARVTNMAAFSSSLDLGTA